MAMLLVLFFTLLPYFGLFLFRPSEIALHGEIGNDLKIAYSLYLFLFYASIMFSYYKSRLPVQANRFFSNYLSSDGSSQMSDKLLMIKVIIVQILIILIMLKMGAFNIISNLVNRGEFRVSLGSTGFIYALITNILPSSLVCFSFVIFNDSVEKKKILFLQVIVVALGILIGFLTGFKVAPILILFASLVFLFPKINIKAVFSFSVFALVAALIASYYYKQHNIKDVFEILLTRATTTAVEGSVAVWNNFKSGCPDAEYSFLYYFGNKIASMLLGVATNSVEYLKVVPSRYMGYLTYPNKEEAISGAFNLTITNFGEAVYLLGHKLCYFYAILSGIFIGHLAKFLNYVILESNSKILRTLTATYFTSVALLWLSNGAVTNLFSLPHTVFFGITYLVLRLICFDLRRKAS